MTDLNSVILIGNLTRDVGADEKDFGYTANGSARANISIAVNRSVKKGEQWEDEVSFFDVTVWGKTAENLKPYFVKGQKVAIRGYLKQDRWEKDGQKFSRVGIVAEHVQLVGEKKADSNGGNPAYSQNTGSKPAFTPNENPQPSIYGENGFAEDVPF